MSDQQRAYLIWKKDFLLKQYEEDRICKNELHAAKMRIVLLKECKLSNFQAQSTSSEE